MARKTNVEMLRLVKKRDKAYDMLIFNEAYPRVVAETIQKENKIALDTFEIESKKKLLPLEIAAMPAATANAELREEVLLEFVAKQALPRRAVQQSYLRKAKAADEEQARKYRDEQLKRLDKAAEDYKAKLYAKYPVGTDAAPPKDAVDKYEKALQEEEAKRAALLARLEASGNAKKKQVNEKLGIQCKKLQAVFEGNNAKLRNASGMTEAEFGADNILYLKNIKMYFSGIKAVDDLTFKIKAGEIFGLIGPNGAGKTTLFNCITQFYKPTGGDVYYRDRYDNIVKLTDYLTHDVVKTGIARTFQNLEMVLGISVLDNLLIGAHSFYRTNLAQQFLHTKRFKDEEEVARLRAVEVLEKLNLIQYKDLPPQGLPYGVLKRIELARTLMTKPRLIILDEPAAGLNDAETEELAEIIRGIRDDYKCTIFLVEHDMNLVMNVCDTICAISFGKMLAIGTSEEIQANPLVQEAYLGEEGDRA